ncbi:MAG: sensor histidine kinase [Myxococcota bacterium]
MDVAAWRRPAHALLERLAVDTDTVSAEERRGFRAFSRRLMADTYPAVALLFVAAALLWWPLDPLLLAHAPSAVRGLAEVRATTVGAALVFLVLARTTHLVRRAPALLGTLGLLLPVGVIGATLAPLSGFDDGPWFHLLYVVPNLSALLLVPLPRRVLAAFALSGAALVGYVAGEPAHLHDPMLGLSASYLVFATLLSVVIGHALHVLLLGTFVQRHRLAALNADLEARVAEQTRDLRDLLSRLQDVREEERAWIARELHDALGQQLTAMRYTVAYARTPDGDAARTNGALAELEQLLGDTDETVRRILDRLRPVILDRLGLVAAARWLLDDVARRTGLETRLDVRPESLTVPPDRATALFRILQEGVHNVTRHADAGRVDVRLERLDDGGVRLRVDDDGVGLPPEPTRGSTGLGLESVRERAGAFGGTARWEASPAGGARLDVRLPAPDEMEAAR